MSVAGTRWKIEDGGGDQRHTIKETPWIDAWVRWERDSKIVYNDDEEDDIPLVPTDTFTFRFPHPDNGHDHEGSNDHQRFIDIELRGFPSDSEQTWNSTGLTLWRSSQYLCDYLVDNAHLLQRRKQILELGSGLGQCGLLASQIMSSDSTIVLTDGDTNVLAQLRDNIKQNTSDSGMASNIFCRQLLWGRDDDKNGGNHSNDQSFDVILGSDLIYVPTVVEPLFETVTSKLSRSTNGVFIMAHCARRHVGSEVTIDGVLQASRQAGLTYQLVDQDDDIFVYTFHWNTSNI